VFEEIHSSAAGNMELANDANLQLKTSKEKKACSLSLLKRNQITHAQREKNGFRKYKYF
jgi:hypothetical protein